MASDDIIYTLAMLTSVVVGPIFCDVLKNSASRQLVSAIFGVLLLVGTCGYHFFHLLITILGNCIILLIIDPANGELQTKERKLSMAGISFLWNFGYLALFRTIHWFGFPAPSPITNAAQLFLTLRMVGLAFEIQDSYWRKSENNLANELKIKYSNINVNCFAIISYGFCYIGLFTGPYYKYRTYHDWLNLPDRACLNRKEAFVNRAKLLPMIAVAFIFFSYFFNIQFVETDEFMDRSFLYRLFYMVPMFIIFRTRLYLAWIMSELMSMTAGLGAYPVESYPKCGEGPTDYKKLDIALEEEKVGKKCNYNFEAIHNIHIYGCELAPMTKQGLRSWNMTVQYWLATYVHRRVPQSFKAYRVAITMTVSAFWHGIHPGYYLSFLTVPPILAAEDLMIKAFREGKSAQVQQVFDWCCWFFKMRGFDYMCMGFLLLRLDSTLRYWYSIYFMGHVVMMLFLAIGKIALSLRPKKRKNLGDGDSINKVALDEKKSN